MICVYTIYSTIHESKLVIKLSQICPIAKTFKPREFFPLYSNTDCCIYLCVLQRYQYNLYSIPLLILHFLDACPLCDSLVSLRFMYTSTMTKTTRMRRRITMTTATTTPMMTAVSTGAGGGAGERDAQGHNCYLMLPTREGWHCNCLIHN